MTPQSAHKILILFLLFLKCIHGSGMMMHGSGMMMHGDHHYMHSNQEEAVRSVGLLTMDDMKVGNTIKVKLPFDDTSSSHFLPKDVADSIPFSSSELPNILKLFSFSEDSSKASAMKETLIKCEDPPTEGEIKTCATSLESLLDFARNIFVPSPEPLVLTTTHDSTSLGTSESYKILGFEWFRARKTMACHLMDYPYVVYYCHHQLYGSEVRVFRVSLEGDKGDKVEGFGSCHMDTSKWNSDHVLFQVTKTKPGAFPVCHMFLEGELIWVQPI
ncbi:BURP domain-containing protein BNM2A-like [Tripterygium wilfordii]|uniref:BURP domain-containing protein BNM2A-like n=1 Tax=Tripterygium wilfordii TaxID=458696 RepID=UPI0018F85F43|nr:BURP domain-containing protein BNM2A-like [Tripterygium wilfordii]